MGCCYSGTESLEIEIVELVVKGSAKLAVAVNPSRKQKCFSPSCL